MNVKLYLAAFFAEGTLLSIHLLDLFDDGLKRLSLTAGVVVALLTCIKLYNDIVNGRQDRKLKKLDIRKKEEELRQLFEKKYADK
jgi:hypothetical protein